MKTILSILLAFVTTAFALSQETLQQQQSRQAQQTEIQQDIKKLLELTGSAKVGEQVSNQMITIFRETYKDVPQEFWDEFRTEIQIETLIDLIAPVYEKYYTHNEIKELIAFYNTPVGKKSIEVLPMLTNDSMKAGQEWGKKIGEQAVEKLRLKGYLEL